MGIYGYISLRITSEKLDFDDINKNIDLVPTTLFKKGETRDSKYGRRTYSEDGWLYEVKFDDNENIDIILSQFVSSIRGYKDYLQSIYNDYYVRLWCDIYSDSAQMGIEISPNTILKICTLGIGMDIQVYSHGDV